MPKSKKLSERQVRRLIKAEVDAEMKEIANCNLGAFQNESSSYQENNKIVIDNRLEISPSFMPKQILPCTSPPNASFDTLLSFKQNMCSASVTSVSNISSNSDSDSDDFLGESGKSHDEVKSSSDNDSDKSFALDKDSKLQSDLRACFIKHNATQTLINDVLIVLKPYHKLPQDARTLMSTPLSTSIKNIGNGEFAYFGLASGIKNKIRRGLHNNVSSLNLIFNIDGLPLFKSSSIDFWPILCKIEDFR